MALLPILIAVLLIVGIMVGLYFFVFLGPEKTTTTTTTTGEDPPPPPEQMFFPLEVSDETKAHLNSIYGGDVVNAAIQKNETEGAPNYLTCTGMFDAYNETCQKNTSLGFTWQWLNDINYTGTRCHALVNKYNVKVLQNGNVRVDTDVEPTETSFGVHAMPFNVDSDTLVQITPVMFDAQGTPYAVSQTAPLAIDDKQRIGCGDLVDAINYNDL